jgi:heme/copper-type cytochrome/quinol oxidase subunit 2
VSNFKNIDFIYQSQNPFTQNLVNVKFVTPSNLFASSSTYATNIKPYFFRNQAVNFQTEISKACSDWVVYYSSVTEVWGFFLFFYFIALFFFFYFIVPKSIPHFRLNTNFATPLSWLSSFISCGVPFFLIFTILYESIYLLFTNENFPVKMLPLFLIEGRQWKWDYRLNFAGLLEYSNLQKVIGRSTYSRLPTLGAHATMDLYQKLNSIFGSELLDNSLRVRTELLKGNRGSYSLRDFNLVNSLASSNKKNINQTPLATNLTSTFLLFKIEETTKRIITATKGVIVPDSPLIKAHITGCDVIHSWTLPSLGVRIDAVPGKVYSVKIPFKHYGVFVGQCSEICGLRHAYMPIAVTFLPSSVFCSQIYLLVFSSLDFFFVRFSRKLTF